MLRNVVNFERTSPIEFCNIVYGYHNFYIDDISAMDMYDYIAFKTDQFNIDIFKYFIIDLRNYCDKLKFTIKNPYYNPEVINDGSLLNFENQKIIDFDKFTPFDYEEKKRILNELNYDSDKLTLGERIKIYKTHPEVTWISGDIKRLLQFSDIAEKEYKKVCEQAELYNNNINQKIILNELNSKEFIEYCFNNEVPGIEMFDYLKDKTDGFEIEKIKTFIKLLENLADRIEIFVIQDIETNGVIQTKEIKDYLFGYLRKFQFTNANSKDPDTIALNNDIVIIDKHFNVREALTTAWKINKQIRPSSQFSNYLCILGILHNNVKDYPRPKDTIDNYLDLTLHQFIDHICNFKPVIEFTFIFDDKPEINDFIMKGSQDRIEETIKNSEIPLFRVQELLNRFYTKKLPTFNRELTDIEVYNYLETTTSGFNTDKCNILLNSIDAYYVGELIKKVNDESYFLYRSNYWILPQLPGYDENSYTDRNSYDFEKMREKSHPQIEIAIGKVKEMLRTKINKKDKSKESNPPTPTIQTIWKNDDELTSAYHRLNKLIDCDLDTWLYWFGGISHSNPPKIKWIYKKGQKRALTYFIEKISLSKTIDYANARKIFDVQIYSNAKYQVSFKDIDEII